MKPIVVSAGLASCNGINTNVHMDKRKTNYKAILCFYIYLELKIITDSHMKKPYINT